MEGNLSLYNIFNTVAATCNISHASKELYISQPAVSKSISRLEENLGVRLFKRTSRGVVLTEEGMKVYEYSKNAFHTLQLGEANIKKINQLGIGHLRIGVSTTLCKYILLPYLESFVNHNPHIKITIQCQSTFQTLELLEQGNIDIGLIGKPNNIKNIDFYSIQTIEDTFVATSSYLENLSLREHHISKTRSSSLLNDLSTSSDIFKTANIMLLDEKNMTRLYIEDYFTRNNIHTNQLLEVSNMDLLIEFAKIGLGVSCVIKEFIKEELDRKELIEITLEKPLKKREIGFAYQLPFNQSDSLFKFIEFYKFV